MQTGRIATQIPHPYHPTEHGDQWRAVVSIRKHDSTRALFSATVQNERKMKKSCPPVPICHIRNYPIINTIYSGMRLTLKVFQSLRNKHNAALFIL
jgi:hypothetical protein